MIQLPRLATVLHAVLLRRIASRRPPDFIVGEDSDGGPYLLRWYLTPWRHLQTRVRQAAEANPTHWNRTRARMIGLLPNLYLHKFLRDDDDRALHDHPSWAASLILAEGYIEHTIHAGGIHDRAFYRPGALRFMGTRHAHRIELNGPMEWRDEHDDDGYVIAVVGKRSSTRPCWTLFLFGPTVRDWGFHCPERGWVHWRDFTAAGKPGEIGPGCDA